MIYIKLFLSLLILIVLFYFSFFVFTKENFEVTTSSYIDKIDDNQILDIYNVKSKCKDLEKNNFEIDYPKTFKYILDNTFIKVPNIETIDLENQMINALNSHTFDKLEKLDVLKLNGNNLKVIGSNIFHNNLGLKKSKESKLRLFYDGPDYEKIMIVVYPETIIRLSMLGVYPELNGICYSNIEDNEEKIYDLLYKLLYKTEKYRQLIKRLLGVDENYLGDFNLEDKTFDEIFRLVYYKDIFYNTDTAHWRKRFEKYTPVTTSSLQEQPYSAVTTSSLQEKSYSIDKFCVYDNKYDNKYFSCIDLYQKIIEYKAIVEENKAILDDFKHYGGGNLKLNQHIEKYMYYKGLMNGFYATDVPEYIINAMSKFGNIDAETNCHVYNICKNKKIKNEWEGETGFLKEIDDSEYLSPRIPTMLSQELEQTHPIELSADNKTIISNQILPSCQSNLIEGFFSSPTSSAVAEQIEFNADTVTLPSLSGIVTIQFTGSEIPESWYKTNEKKLQNVTELHVVITESIETIGDSAFRNCIKITSLRIIPNSVTTIGDAAFRNCTSLASLTFDSSSPGQTTTMNIGSDAFRGCSLITSLIIPNYVTSIGNYTFYNCTSLETLTIPNSVTSIGNSAFRSCSSIRSLTIPNSVTSIGVYAFYNCRSLESIEFELSSTGQTTTMIIGGLAFASWESYSGVVSNTNVTELKIPNYITRIGYDAFRQFTALKTLTFESESSLEFIGWNVFENCSLITSLTIPNSVTSIGSKAFYNCTSLETLTFEQDSQLETIGMLAFYASGITSLTIPNSVTSIGNKAFFNCTSLETLTFEQDSQLVTIGDFAFTLHPVENNNIYEGPGTKVNELTIPESVEHIGQGAFARYYDLNTLTFEPGSKLKNLNDYAFLRSNINSLEIPKFVETIGFHTFYHCSSLKSLTFEDENNLRIIGAHSFENCSSITSLTIPKSVTTIGNLAFYDCTSLETLTFEQDSQLVTIGNYAFYNCSSITSLTIPNSVTSIGIFAFYNCIAITSLTFESDSKLNTINNYAFEKCSAITSLTIPNSVTTIGNLAFYDCSSITSLIIPNSVTSIVWAAFYNCTSLGSIEFESSLENQDTTMTIGNYAFASWNYIDDVPGSNTNVTKLTIPNYITSIGEVAFRQFTELKSIEFEENSQLDTIGNAAFYKCTSLKNIIRIPEKVTIGIEAFNDCGCISSSIGCDFQPGDTIIDCKKVKCNTYAIENKHFLGLKRKVICADYVMRADDLYTLIHQTEEQRFSRLIKKLTIAGQNQNDENILKEIKLANLLHNLEIQGDKIPDMDESCSHSSVSTAALKTTSAMS